MSQRWNASVRELKLTARSGLFGTVKVLVIGSLVSQTGANEIWGQILSGILGLRVIILMIYGEYKFYYEEDPGPFPLSAQIARYITNVLLMELLIPVLGLDIRLGVSLPAPLFDFPGAVRARALLDERQGVVGIGTCTFVSERNHCWRRHGVPGVIVYVSFLYLVRSLWVDFQRLWMNAVILVYKLCQFMLTSRE